MSEVVRAHVRVSGRVQGVGFRFRTCEEAQRLGVRGWVRNLLSRDVEAVFEGDERAVQQIVAWCNEGPPGAWVRSVRVSWDEPPQGLAGFELRATED